MQSSILWMVTVLKPLQIKKLDINKKKALFRKAKLYYFECRLGLVVFYIELHPLLGDAAHTGIGFVDKLEAGDVGAAFSQVCQVNVQETLRWHQDGYHCKDILFVYYCSHNVDPVRISENPERIQTWAQSLF